MDRFHHQSKDWIDNGAGFLGVEVLHERHGAFEVSKQRGDGFALAVGRTPDFYRRLLGEDDAATVRTLTAHRTGPEIGIVNLTLAAQKSLPRWEGYNHVQEVSSLEVGRKAPM
jgi:hypothetical protein